MSILPTSNAASETAPESQPHMLAQKSVEQKEESRILGNFLKVLSIPISLAIGTTYGLASARNQFYTKFKHRGALAEEYEKLNKSAQEIFPKWGETKDIQKDIKALDAAYELRSEKRLCELGYDTTWKRFKALHRNQKMETALTFVTATGIAFGVILTIADHKGLLDHLSKIYKKDKGPDVVEH